MKALRHAGACLALACASFGAAAAPAAEGIDTSAPNLLAVLRESPGANKQEGGLLPYGKIALTTAEGREIEVEASWFRFLGDMHLRLVFDGDPRMQSAVPQDLQRLDLSPEAALATAVANLRRRYGPPEALPYGAGLMQVRSSAPELASSYFLDLDFWREQQRAHPGGLVAAVPVRGGIVFAPADDDLALASLRFSATAIYTSDERARLSTALYLFKEGRWSVYQAATGAR